MGVVDIQQVALAGIGIADMAVTAHALAFEAKRLQPVSGEDIIGQHGLPGGGDSRAITLAQGAPQSGLQMVGAVRGLAVQVQQPQPGQRENAQARLRQRLLEYARKHEQCGECHLPAQVDQGELTAQPGREKVQGHEPVQPARLDDGADGAAQAENRQE